MAVLDSQEARRQFRGKLAAVEDTKASRDHYFYFFHVGTTATVSTKISIGPRHTIADDLVARMARQLGVTSTVLHDAVSRRVSRA